MSGTGENLVQLGADNRSFYVPAFELKVRGSPMPRNVVRDVSEVTYEDGTDRVDSFTLSLGNWDATTRQPKYIGLPAARMNDSDAKLFEPGNEIQLSMGYQSSLKLMMTGYITTLDVEFPEQGGSRAIVHGLNVIDRLRRRQFTWTWPDDGSKQIRDSDIALLLARDADDGKGRPGLGMKVRVDPAAQAREPSLDHVTMNNQYPIVFLLERARRNGYEVTVDEEAGGGASGQPQRSLYFGPTVDLSDVTYVLEWGRSLQSFRPVYGSAKQLYAVTVCGWDRRAKKKIQERTTLDTLSANECPNHDLIDPVRTANREDFVTDQPVNTIEEARKRGQAILREQQHGMVKVSGATVGLPDLRAGRVVVIRGSGMPFDGRYFVTSTRHIIGEQGYRTSFEARRFGPEFGRSEAGVMNAPVMSGSRMDGLAIGTVLNVEDPNGEGRIQLEMAVATGRATTAWAPIAALMAGNDRGTWMLPEVGDEVLVGFVQGDPDQPYILGFLWNGQDKPPSTAPRERMIRSLNGHTIRMIDEEPKNGAKGAIVIEDAHGNTITMSNGKIAIKSVAVLALEAPVITLSGGGWTRVVTPNSNPL